MLQSSINNVKILQREEPHHIASYFNRSTKSR